MARPHRTDTRLRDHSRDEALYMGIDLGTSGARISVIRGTNHTAMDEVFTKAIAWDTASTTSGYGRYDDPDAWTRAVHDLMQAAVEPLDVASRASVQSLCISGTSASCLLVEAHDGRVTRRPLMYHHAVSSTAALSVVQSFAPLRHTATSATGSLAKLVSWHLEEPLRASERLCHQADYVLWHCLDRDTNDSDATEQLQQPQQFPMTCSDWHNCLKLGYDVQTLQWPSWLMDCLTHIGVDHPSAVLPHTVVSPGVPVGRLRRDWAHAWGLSQSRLVAGTTDSNAAFWAATQGVSGPGTAVTSLGSTLAIKQVSTTYVEDATRGVYSHRIPSVLTSGPASTWLVGGASNVGCAILRALNFTNDELDTLNDWDPTVDSPYAYYPLVRPGERFPVADANQPSVVTPVPASRSDYLHGLLQGIANVERDGFVALQQLGATPPYPHQVWTCGGGSRNDRWTTLRQRRLRTAFAAEVVVQTAQHVEASYGAALLAAASFL